MLLPEVLEDVAWWLTRTDLDTINLIDAAHTNFVAVNLQCKGPLRLISSADLSGTTVQCKSGGDEREVASVVELCSYLRNACVQRLTLKWDALIEDTLVTLRSVKVSYELQCLDVHEKDTNADLLALALDDVFSCRALAWTFGQPAEDEASEEAQTAVTSTFFKSSVLQKVRWLSLRGLPRCDVQLIANWLHRGTVSEPRNLDVWWHGDHEFNSASLISILKEQFLASGEQVQYEFYAGHEVFDVKNITTEYLENSSKEVLVIETRVGGYCDVNIIRLPKHLNERTQIVATTDGPKLWDFASVQELDAHASGHSLLEVLARSRLIANEINCQCGRAMHRRQNYVIRTEVTTPDDFKWRCSGVCADEYGSRRTTSIRQGSWFASFLWYPSVEIEVCLRLLILLATAEVNDELMLALLADHEVQGDEFLVNFKFHYEDVLECGQLCLRTLGTQNPVKQFCERLHSMYSFEEPYNIR